jgi:hypothetical protein
MPFALPISLPNPASAGCVLQSERSSSVVANLSIASRDRWLSNIIKALEVNEAIATVLASEPLKLTALVFQNSPVEIVGHSNVKSTRAAADDVDAVVVFFHKFTGPIELSS